MRNVSTRGDSFQASLTRRYSVRLGRFTIYKLMVGVAIVAVNLAVFRALYGSRRIDILVGGAAVWLVLQVGIAFALRAGGRNRPCWLGFVAAGLLASLTLIAARYSPGSVFGRVWYGYGVVAVGFVSNERAQYAICRAIGNMWGELAVALLITAVEFAPLVLAAGAGGLFARLASRRND